MLPERAIAMAAGVLVNVTGRESPDILFFGSNLWCVRGHCCRCDCAVPAAKPSSVPASLISTTTLYNKLPFTTEKLLTPGLR